MSNAERVAYSRNFLGLNEQTSSLFYILFLHAFGYVVIGDPGYKKPQPVIF